MNINEMKWIREPSNYSVGENRIEIETIPYTDLGKERTIIFAMIMPQYCRWKQKKSIFHLS